MAEPTVTPVRLRTLLVSGILGAGVTFLVLTALESFSIRVPGIPWTTPALIGAGAAVGAVLARATYVRNHVNRRPAEPRDSVMTLAVARAMMVGGALLTGGYLVFSLMNVAHLQAATPRERFARGLVSAVASLAVVITGWLVERACRAPEPPEDDEDDETE